LETTIEELSAVTRKIKVVIPDEDVRREMDTAYEKMKKDLVIPGFRRGKVPKHIVEMRMGGALKEDAAQSLAGKALEEALKEHALSPVSDPVMKQEPVEEGSPLIFEAVIEILPDFDVGEYHGIDIPAKEVKPVTNEDIEKELEFLRRNEAVRVPVENRAAADGDFVTLDYSQEIEGKVDTSKDWVMRVNRETMLPELFENLVGINIGEKKEFDAVLPEDFRDKSLAGKAVKIKVDIKEIKAEQLPELNDDLVREVSDCETLKELREQIHKSMEENRRLDAIAAEKNLILEQLVQSTDLELPQSLLDRQTKRNITRYVGRELYRGMSKKTVDENREEIFRIASESSVRQLKGALIIEQIAEKEGIKITEEEIERKLEEITQNRDISKEEFEKAHQRQDYLDDLRQEMLYMKVLDFLHEHAVKEPQKKKKK